MSVHALSWAFSLQMPNIKSATHKAVLLVLANYADERGYCWPSQGRLADEAACSKRTVGRILADLEASGLISRTQRKRPDGTYTTDGILLHAAAATTNGGRHKEPPQPASVQTPNWPTVNLATGEAPSSGQICTQPVANLTTLTTFEPTKEEPTKRARIRAREGPPEISPEAPKPAKSSPQAYPPDFEALWKSWPKSRRTLSDKREAFKRWRSAQTQRGFSVEQIAAAAKTYLSQPSVAKEGWRYCVLAEVFLNGKLDAAVEAAGETAVEDAGDPLARYRAIAKQRGLIFLGVGEDGVPRYDRRETYA